MSFSSAVSLGSLRLKAQQKADLENSPNIQPYEWNGLIQDGYKELYDLLIAAYGNDWFINNPSSPYQFSLTGLQYYALPSDFYKLIGVDLQYSGSPTGWVTLRRFEEIERNRYAFPNTSVNFLGYTNLKYRLSGNFIEFIPLPMAGQLVQLKYVPQPTNIQWEPICSTTASSTSVTITYPTASSDIANLTAGMTIVGNGIPSGTTIVSVVGSTITLSQAATLTLPVVNCYCWTDSTLIEGVSGWEKFIVCDAAINAQVKQEQIDGSDVLVGIREAMRKRLEDMSEARDIGQACHVSDNLIANGGYDGYGMGYGGYDGGGFF